MAIDLRAYVYCSLGPLVSADIADDYVQDSGLVRCRGTAVIQDIITPDVGSIVDFGYAKNGRLARIPRRLRVLSSSANPYTGLTTLEIGCLLTYKQDYKQPEEALLKSINDPSGIIDVPAEARKFLPPYISASWIFATCMERLGITGSAQLTNRFIAEDFPLDAPYVEIISNLLKSECKFGYLDVNEVLQVKSLYDSNTNGPLYDDNSIIEIESIGVGELPGEAVYVPFASRRLKPPENDNPTDNQLDRINWELSERVSTTTIYLTTKTGAVPYNVIEKTTERTKYRVIPIYRRAKTTVKGLDGNSGIIDIEVETNVYERVEDKEVVEVTISEKELPVISCLGNLATAKIEAGIDFPNYSVFEKTVNTFFYDKEGNETQSISETYESESALVGKMNILTYYKQIILPSGSTTTVFINTPGVEANILTKREVNTRETVGNYQQSITDTYVHFIDTQEGQQAIATGTQKVRTKDEANTFISNAIRSGLVLQGTNIERRLTGKNTAQVRPNAAERAAEKTTKTLKETVDGLTIETPKFEFVYGGITSQTFIEFTMPYVPDDHFIVTGTPPTQSIAIVPSDARSKAIAYGTIQNRLRLANRAGINIKVAPEVVPVAPYSPCYVKAAGTTGHFRVNGSTWSMSASGIACGMDLLYWGAVGQDPGGRNWLPIAPGITALPTTPPITIGTSPVPAMSTEIPEGFDLKNPDLEELFESILPTSGNPVYPGSMEPTVTIPPYNLTLSHLGRISLTPVARITAPANVLDVVTVGISVYNSYQTDDAVLLLNFEGAPGSTVINDVSTYNYEPESVSGAASLASGGKTGQSFYSVPLSDWDPQDPGTGSRITYSERLFGPGYGDFTIECWLNLTERVPRYLNDYGGTYRILTLNYPQFTNLYSNCFSIYDDNYSGESGDWLLEGFFDTGLSGYYYFSTYINGIFTPGQWHHFAVARVDGQATVYWDGQAIASEDWTGLDFGAPEPVADDSIFIGNLYSSNVDNWTGGIDGFAMYHRAKYTGPFIPSTKLFRKFSGPALVP